MPMPMKKLYKSLFSFLFQSNLSRQNFYFLIVVGIVLALLYTQIQYLNEVSTQQKILIVQAETKLQLLDAQLAKAIVDFDKDEVANIGKMLAMDEQITYVKIQAQGLPLIAEGNLRATKIFSTLHHPIETIQEGQSKNLGVVEVGLNCEKIRDQGLSDMPANFLFNALRIVVLVVLVGLFFYRAVTKPFRELALETQGYQKNLLPYLAQDENFASQQKLIQEQIGDLQQLQSTIQNFKLSFDKAIKIQNQTELEKTKAEIELAREKERREYYQRMELLGRLTAQVTHDFNNIIFLATLKTESLERKLGPELQIVTKQIRGILHQSNEIIDLLLSYVRQKPKERQVYVLSTLIVDMVSLFEVALGRRYNLIVEGLDLSVQVFVEKVSLSSAILNLLVNARDAQPDGGEIKIVLAQISDMEVEIKVIDQGMGIPVELHEKIFEPLFTTKSDAQGTGLGLSQVKDTIESFGGRVSVKSTRGVDSAMDMGTEFSLVLPLVKSHDMMA